MEAYLDLSRRFTLLPNYTPSMPFASPGLDKCVDWNKILEGRFSVIVGRANLGKTMELKAKSKALRAEGQTSLYVALHKVLSNDALEDALDAEDTEALASWKTNGGQLTAFVDSLDEASFATEDGIRKALRRLQRAVAWSNPDVKLVLSSRPAVLTDDILDLLQTELRTTLYTCPSSNASDQGGVQAASIALAEESDDLRDNQASTSSDGDKVSSPAMGDVASATADSKTENKAAPEEQLKLYALLPLDKAGASLYLQKQLTKAVSHETLLAAAQYGLEPLAESPGGLDILVYLDLVERPPQYLSQAFNKVVEAVQQQQRIDPRERQLGNPLPESLDQAIGRLASASVVCQLPNIEMSTKALQYRDGVLSARPLIASFLSDPSLAYLLGSRLFIDSGEHQVKLYPDEMLPFLAAKHLAARVKSPDHARRLMANFAWRATTGECGVHRALLPLAGWLAVFNVHCRQEILSIEPQAVAFFGDLRHPAVQLHEASEALERSIERLVSDGDSLGRSFYTLTAENFWQAAKPGIEPTLRQLFNKFGTDWHARHALLKIAGYARLEIFRDGILDCHDWNYSKLLHDSLDLNYLLSLNRNDDIQALGAALKTGMTMLGESQVARLISELAWRALDAKSIAEIAAGQFSRGRGGFSVAWEISRDVAQEASDINLYRLTRSLLLRLVSAKVDKGRDAERYWSDQKFVELVIDLLAQVIQRRAVQPSRAGRLCLLLSCYINEQHLGSADNGKLRAALQTNKPVRIAFLRSLIQRTDKSADGIFQAVFMYSPIYQHVAGDELELAEPGYTEHIERQKAAEARPLPKPTKRRDREYIVDRKSKSTLLGMLDELRDASNESALAWVAQWLAQSIGLARYSECNFELFERAAGSKIALAVREGLSVLWRTKNPTWKEYEQNSTYNITIAGLHGLHLDLGDGSQLPALKDAEVRRAIRYAQFEINGYPKWFWRLAAAYEQVATQELKELLISSTIGPVSFEKAERLIRHLDEASGEVQRGLATMALDFVLRNSQLDEHTLEAALSIAVANKVINEATFEMEAWKWICIAFDAEMPALAKPTSAISIEESKERQSFEQKVQELKRQKANAVVWGSFWLRCYPGSFAKQCQEWRESSPEKADRFMLTFAAHQGKDRGIRLRQVSEMEGAGLEALHMLYKWICLLVKEQDDIEHEDGQVYSPGERDYSQRLRDALVPAIAHAKSEHAYEILEDIRKTTIGDSAKYLRHVQFMMREEQYARKSIAQTDYLEFERTFAPQVSTYFEFALAVETDLLSIKSQIETGDFSLRRFFNSVNFKRFKTEDDGLALEEDFQILLGSELNHAAAGRYVVTLEPILSEGTRRDVLCQIGSLRATVELKMSFRWTLAEYIEALEKQLHGQYMMAPNSMIGFFVIVLQKNRAWDGPDGKRIKFDEVIAILKEKAREKMVANSSIHLRVIGINAAPKEDFRAKRKAAKTANSTAPAKYTDGFGNIWGGRGRKPKWVRDALAAGKNLEDLLSGVGDAPR